MLPSRSCRSLRKKTVTHVIVFQKPHPYGSLDIKKLKGLIANEANPSQETVLERRGLLAKTFRELMTNGQKFTEVNAYRRSFFDEVIALVEEVGFPSYSSSYRDDPKRPPRL
jgi:hypothetical protein